MKKVIGFLFLICSIIPDACDAQTNWIVFEQLDNPLILPSETNVGDVVLSVCKHIDLTVEIPDQLQSVVLDRSKFSSKSLKTPVMAKTCLALALDETVYGYIVCDGKLEIVLKEKQSEMVSATVHNLEVFDLQTVAHWKDMVVRVIQPTIWKKNGGDSFIEVHPKSKKAVIQCPGRVHKQIENFNLILKSYIFRKAPPPKDFYVGESEKNKVLRKTANKTKLPKDKNETAIVKANSESPK